MQQNVNEWGYTEEAWNALHKSKRWRIKNPDKQKAAVKSWIDRNRDHRKAYQRAYQINKKYGVDEEWFASLSLKQKGVCAICGQFDGTGKWKKLVIDHDHNTGKIRGLLCNECNRGIGYLKDSVDILEKSVEYLKQHKDSNVGTL